MFKKALLEKRKNEDEIDEHWVQCDHCEGWVHQICGMFNKGRNTTEDHYLCPSCLLLGMEMGVRQPLQVRLCAGWWEMGVLIPVKGMFYDWDS
jgi:E1A/CREB-binding protein